MLLEDVRVLPQAQLAEELRQVRTFQRRVQAAAVAAGYRRDAVHVVAAAEIMLCNRFVLLPLWAADSGGELGVARQTVTGAVPLSPVVGITAVSHAFPAAGSRQGQRGPLVGGAHAGLV